MPRLRAAALADPGAAVLMAPPGTGKTTVVPLRLLDEPWLAGRRIVVLEPRRLATRAAARRMADDARGEEVGATVGYHDARRTARRRGHPGRGGHRGCAHPPPPARSGAAPAPASWCSTRSTSGTCRPTSAWRLPSTSGRRCGPTCASLAMSATPTPPPGRACSEVDEPAPVRQHGRPGVPTRRALAAPGASDRLEPAAVGRRRLSALRDEAGDVLVFLPGAAEIRRVGELLAELVARRPTSTSRPLVTARSPVRGRRTSRSAPSPPGRRRVVLATDIAEIQPHRRRRADRGRRRVGRGPALRRPHRA